MKELLRKILLTLSICVFCFSAYKLVEIKQQYQKVENENKALKKEVVIEDINEEFTVDFKKLNEMNQDTIGWFYIEDEEKANNVIVQSYDNDYYLRRNFERAYSFAGTLFVDYRNTNTFNDFNTIVYGHNMRDDSMLGFLIHYYQDENYYKEHPNFQILQEGVRKTYAICFASRINLANTLTYSFGELGYEHRQAMINEWASLSYIQTGQTASPEDKFVTLSSCTYDLNPQYRYIVVGKLISEEAL